MMEFKKHIHFDVDLETAIIGACLIEKDAYARIHGILEPEVFYSNGNKIVFESISKMWDEGQPIDILTVTSFIARKGIEQ